VSFINKSPQMILIYKQKSISTKSPRTLQSFRYTEKKIPGIPERRAPRQSTDSEKFSFKS
jgi:hypothetical protein